VNAPPVKHPRRFGFVTFNAVMVIAAAGLIGFLAGNTGTGGFGAVPNTALAAGGLVVLAIVWIGTWIAWGAMVWRRRRLRA
jgi:hypothetical protein